MKSNIITLDGHAAAGKGETAKVLSSMLNLPVLDSGRIFRAVAYIWEDDKTQFERISFDGKNLLIDGSIATNEILRTPEISSLTPKIAAIPEVRQRMLPIVRAYATEKGLIADGRDMGSIVFPDAPLKMFLTARAVTRARREMSDPTRGRAGVALSEVLAGVLYRDHLDETRKDAPLVRAPDAILLDTSELTIQEVADTIVQLWSFKQKI
ncbi:MAG: (d)CMP kinase [Candidatus Pacebacteria bacterium]|nr:(d)CMP kinase [Candidatus Paceibacterota bacterium]